jgi:hypothetical protein
VLEEHKMNAEKLLEYRQREDEEYERFKKAFVEGRAEQYPAANRFRHLRQPVGLRALDSSLWPQIPIFGSLLIPIYPAPKSAFASVYKFDIRDLDRLIDLWKDTGKVQFMLAANPMQFAGLNHYDRLLSEVKPPLMQMLPIEAFASKALVRSLVTEFWTAARISFIPMMAQRLGYASLGNEYVFERCEQLAVSYAYLKVLGFENLAYRIQDLLIEDPFEAERILYFNKAFILNPLVDPMKSVPCFSLEYLQKMKSVDIENRVQRTTFPNEVGAFLMKELTLFPDNFSACMHLLQLYEQQDLGKVVEALSAAVANSDLDIMKAKQSDLAAIFRNVWSEAYNISKRIDGISNGLTIALGVGGFLAGQMLAGEDVAVAGLLGGMGLSVLDKSTSAFVPKVSEKLVKFFAQGNVSAVFDFKKKYRISR